MKATALLSIAVALFCATAVAGSLQEDIASLIKAAEKRDTLWPWKGAEPEVAVVAAHGKAAGQILVSYLADDPEAANNWHVQQQIALALCKIYGVSEEGGHVYMNRATPEANASVKTFWLAKVNEK